MKTFVKGIYKRAIFKSDKGYVIGILKIKETDDESLTFFVGRTITFTGYFHELNEEDLYEFHGEVTEHPKYGMQYDVVSYERVKPTDKEGLVLFLSSDLFKGVGEKLATKIVEHLGENTIDRILKEPECLNLVPGLTKKKEDTIINTLQKYEESSTTTIYLTELGFSMKEALLIYNMYKKHTITKIKHNIYDIIEDIHEISFQKADLVGRNLEIEAGDERRIKALILYKMRNHVYQAGDTYLTKEEIYNLLTHALSFPLDTDVFLGYLQELMMEDKIIEWDTCYYLKEIYDAERNIIHKMTTLLKKETETHSKLDYYINEMEEFGGITYNEKQKEAIRGALSNNLFIITGGPGTGKTTIIKAIIDAYVQLYKVQEKDMDTDIVLLAPTGRASKRMSDGAVFPASTIHRFLKWNKETGEFAVNEMNKAPGKLIIVDEASMIDLELMDHLLKGLTNQIKLVLVGDANQLPSVGPGQLLKDLIDSQVIKTAELDLLYRQSENSYIPFLAQEIKENELKHFEEKKEDYQFLSCTPDSVIASLKNICIKAIDKGYSYKKLQIMAPMYRGINGIDSLNKHLQEVFNPKDESKKELEVDGILYREQDKILQLVNMPEENIFNGDIGIICKIDKAPKSESKKNEIYVDFDGTIVKYLPKDFSKMKHGFVISIHKSQGSEFDFVILPIVRSYQRMLYRKLIYTAVTRAKKKLILIGEKEAFIYSVSNNAEYIRKTNFCKKLSAIRINEID